MSWVEVAVVVATAVVDLVVDIPLVVLAEVVVLLGDFPAVVVQVIQVIHDARVDLELFLLVALDIIEAPDHQEDLVQEIMEAIV